MVVVDLDARAGYFRTDYLDMDAWNLTEVAAPAGYVKTDQRLTEPLSYTHTADTFGVVANCETSPCPAPAPTPTPTPTNPTPTPNPTYSPVNPDDCATNPKCYRAPSAWAFSYGTYRSQQDNIISLDFGSSFDPASVNVPQADDADSDDSGGIPDWVVNSFFGTLGASISAFLFRRYRKRHNRDRPIESELSKEELEEEERRKT
jgi:hypothetical protein